MKSNKYLDDITEIKNMMNKSSRFISLSGLSGILAGLYSLIGAYFANQIIANIRSTEYSVKRFILDYDATEKLIGIAITVILLSIITGIFLSYRKSKKSGEKIWDLTSKRLVFNFLIPLVTGGLFCIILIQNKFIGLIAPTTLIFYGLACVNASKYTLGDVRYLGFVNIVIGLIATQFTGYGLFFWALGFGVFHIFYGTLMYFKYDRK
mgnify:CR=1 FL=1|tara:strand:- start:25384 stop:26007 length:624 start_codon:yes stop_codon:yes gene_type:complete